MTPLSLSSLRSAAMAATPEHDRWCVGFTREQANLEAFIAAANPQAILALLDALEAARGAADSVRCPECDGAGGFMQRTGGPDDEEGEAVPCRLCEASSRLHSDDVQGLLKGLADCQRERDNERRMRLTAHDALMTSGEMYRAAVRERDALREALAIARSYVFQSDHEGRDEETLAYAYPETAAKVAADRAAIDAALAATPSTTGTGEG